MLLDGFVCIFTFFLVEHHGIGLEGKVQTLTRGLVKVNANQFHFWALYPYMRIGLLKKETLL